MRKDEGGRGYRVEMAEVEGVKDRVNIDSTAAEGAANREDNPFSFKSFVKRTSTDVGMKSGKCDGAERGKKTRAKSKVPFPEEGGENPFSFKQFVRKQTLTEASEESSSSDGEHSLLDTTQESPSIDHPLALPLTPGAATATTAAGKQREKVAKKPKVVSTSQKSSQTFPAITKKNSNKSDRKQKKQKDPLFDSDSDSFASPSQHTALPFAVTETVVTEHEPLTVFDGQGVEGERISVLRLSDSSEDSIAAPDGQEQSVLQGIQSAEPPPEHLLQKYSQVIAENKQLKTELGNFKEKYRKEKQKNSKLSEQLQALKKKEAEETKALEDMVAKVEENLVASTKRAMAAETTVSKLKQELQSLQVQLSQADAQSVHRHYEELLSGVRDKATFASKQLSMSAMAADQCIRELLSGVDTLKNVAEVLQYIDRISEVKQH